MATFLMFILPICLRTDLGLQGKKFYIVHNHLHHRHSFFLLHPQEDQFGNPCTSGKMWDFCSGTQRALIFWSSSLKRGVIIQSPHLKSLHSSFLLHRKLSSLATKEKPLKALLELVLALNSGVRLTELGTISLVNSGSICWVSAGPFWEKKQYVLDEDYGI